MEVFADIFYVTTIILLLIIVIKTYFFFKKISVHKFSKWFVFSRHDIYGAHSEKSAKARRTQNALSIVVLVVGILDVFFLMLSNRA